jgi:hypothetical protein
MAVTRRLPVMGIRDRPITPCSPWQNGHVERLIGLILSECLDHVVVLGERHLRNLLANYLTYYNGVCTHLALDKDAPFHRPAQTIGRIGSVSWLGGAGHAPRTGLPDLTSKVRSRPKLVIGRPIVQSPERTFSAAGRRRLGGCSRPPRRRSDADVGPGIFVAAPARIRRLLPPVNAPEQREH